MNTTKSSLRFRRTIVSSLAAAGLIASVLLGTGSAYASDYRSNSVKCSNYWSWTSATSTKPTTHRHEIPSYWTSVQRPAGHASYKGIWNGGYTFMELSTSGSFSAAAIGCTS